LTADIGQTSSIFKALKSIPSLMPSKNFGLFMFLPPSAEGIISDRDIPFLPE
jgi:hypothetical protein